MLERLKVVVILELDVLGAGLVLKAS